MMEVRCRREDVVRAAGAGGDDDDAVPYWVEG